MHDFAGIDLEKEVNHVVAYLEPTNRSRRTTPATLAAAAARLVLAQGTFDQAARRAVHRQTMAASSRTITASTSAIHGSRRPDAPRRPQASRSAGRRWRSAFLQPDLDRARPRPISFVGATRCCSDSASARRRCECHEQHRVDDADRATRRATRLGGGSISMPSAAEWVCRRRCAQQVPPLRLVSAKRAHQRRREGHDQSARRPTRRLPISCATWCAARFRLAIGCRPARSPSFRTR